MKSKSIKGHSSSEIKTALTNSMSDGFKPTLAIVFCSINQDIQAISKILDNENIVIFGSSTNGEFIDEETEKGSAAILLLDLNPDYFQIYFEDYTNNDHKNVAMKIAKKAKEKFKNPAFLVCNSNPETDGEAILKGLEDGIGNHINAFGGGAGDDYAFTETFVFTNKTISNNGIAGIALNEEKVTLKGIATCGWKAVGTEKTITKSKGNHIYTIDNIPALDITVKYGGLQNISPDNKDVLLELAANFPLQLQRSKGDPVMRTAMLANREDRSLICAGNVPQGSKIKFSLPPDFDAIETVVEECNPLKVEQQQNADALIMFSCISRHLSFGILMDEEISQVQDVWKAPMVGFFTYGEFGKSKTGKT
ncbi:FIST C-terminal domain-containing protein [Lacinutrix sp. C3R15]|uniref:FIST signal transduction protein n=1 Tax=Flavobacteriaceae TaxID=49546 RepID=UPI001C081012|nr:MULTISPECIES: FIST N-terminal domain-containing protein [Flavobacteriaceae]MBU2938912.1 FIST C-terminal domain-containing protein [Lacinutrix sp. C3R15]MDO6622225.1 FIST N-terminal domain-containing protein [Oceanihabitans sp. 1_MG-2023]